MEKSQLVREDYSNGEIHFILPELVFDEEFKTDEIKKIIESLDELSTKTDSFSFGIIIGRLYNSFYYQCRRLLQRDPTKQEFSEFLEILKLRQSEIHKKFNK